MSRPGLDKQNDLSEFTDLEVPWKCSTSNCIIGAKDHTFIQMNMSKGGRIRNWFIGQFKTYAICRTIHRMGESDACILQLAKADGIVSKNFWPEYLS